MYRYEDIKKVHLEITSKCNASCPLCPRTIKGGPPNPHLPLVELSLDEIKTAFSESFIKQLDRFFMCGNYGDPAAAKDSLEVFKWLREVNPSIFLEIYSNGGLRSESYWSELAQIVDRGRFAIDGLKDTNHIYRKGVIWEKVERNVQAFTRAGGKARWDFIVFRHNEHQVDEAQNLAKHWQVSEFCIKKTGRFFDSENAEKRDEQRVLNKMGELDYKIQLPKNPEYINPVYLKDLKKQVENDKTSSAKVKSQSKKDESNGNSLYTYIEKSPISCKAIEQQSIFLSADGFLFPCCWVGLDTYTGHQKPKSSELWKMLETVPDGIESLRATKIGVEKVLQSEFFQSTLVDSWEKESYEKGKSKRCTKTCGRKELEHLNYQSIPIKKPVSEKEKIATSKKQKVFAKCINFLNKKDTLESAPDVNDDLDQNKVLHLELSTRCSLKCPACPRTNFPGKFPVTDLPLDVLEQIVRNPGFEVNSILLCGDHGDPIYHKDFHKALELLKTVPNRPPIKITTNGSHRSQQWWEDTAKILDHRDIVVFGVDGVKDTNPIHRVNSDWDSIIMAIKTLKAKGSCLVAWQWLLFKFNQEQLPEARVLFDDLEIDFFIIAKSSRQKCIELYDPTISLEEAYNIFTKKSIPTMQSRP